MADKRKAPQLYEQCNKTVGQKKKVPLGSRPLPRREPHSDALIPDIQDFRDKESHDKFVSIFSKKVNYL